MANSTRPIFKKISYNDPRLSHPAIVFYSGVYLQTSNAPSGDQVLAVRLRNGAQNVIAMQKGTSASSLILTPSVPLSASLVYEVDAQYISINTNIQDVNWGSASITATTAILTNFPQLLSGQVGANKVQLVWHHASEGLVATGIVITIIAKNGRAVVNQSATATDNLSFDFQAGTDSPYQLYLAGTFPIQAEGASENTYAVGPTVFAATVPVETVTINNVDYNGDVVQVQWTGATSSSAYTEYMLVVQDSNGSSSMMPADVGGGILQLGNDFNDNWTAHGRIKQGLILGPPGIGYSVITEYPVIDQVRVVSQDGNLQLSSVISFSNAQMSATAWLYYKGLPIGNGVVVSSSGGTATFPIESENHTGYAVRAKLSLDEDSTISTGPLSEPVATMVTSPIINLISCEPDPGKEKAWIVTVQWQLPVTNNLPFETVFIEIMQGENLLATQTGATQGEAMFILSEGAGTSEYIPEQPASAKLYVTTPQAQSPSTTAPFIGVKPILQSVNYETDPNNPSQSNVGIKITTNAPATENQVIEARLLVDGQVQLSAMSASDSSIILQPSGGLSIRQNYTVQARWRTAGDTSILFGGWSDPTSVMTTIKSPLSAQFDGTNLFIQLTENQDVQGYYVYAHNEANNRNVGQAIIGTSGSFAFTPGDDEWSIYTQSFVLSSSGNPSKGPCSPLLPLLLDAPNIQSIRYHGDRILRLEWTVVDDAAGNPASGAIIDILKDDELLSQHKVGVTSASIPFTFHPHEQGTVKVRVRALQGEFYGTYGASILPIIAPPIITGVEISATQVVATVQAPDGTLPSNVKYRGRLYEGTVLVTDFVDSSSNKITFDYPATGHEGISIVAQAYVTDPINNGPLSKSLPLLSIFPGIKNTSITPNSDGSKWIIGSMWSQPAHHIGDIDHYTLSLMEGENLVEQIDVEGVSGQLEVDKTSIDSSKSYNITVVAVAPNGSKSPQISQDLLFDGAALSQVTVNNDRLTATWAKPEHTGNIAMASLSYRMVIVDLSEAINPIIIYRSETFKESTGQIRLAMLNLDQTKSYGLQIEVQSNNLSLMPLLQDNANYQAQLIIQSPTQISSTFDFTENKTNITWQKIGILTNYNLLFTSNDSVELVQTTGETYPITLQPNQTISVQIAAYSSANGLTITGAYSQPLNLLTTKPQLLSVDYDGVNATVTWQSVANASSYIIRILNGTTIQASQTVTAPATETSFASNITSDDVDANFAVTVQVGSGSQIGLPANTMDLFIPAYFVSPNLQNKAAFIYPARSLKEVVPATLGESGTDIVLYLAVPELGGTLPVTSSNGSFVLAENTASDTNTVYPYTLTIAGDKSAWAFSEDPIRSSLQTEYIDFLTSVETQGNASPKFISTLQDIIARYMPQTFDETLYYAFGLHYTPSGGAGYIDLRPGMIMQVMIDDYLQPDASSTETFVRGYIGTGVLEATVGGYVDNNGWKLGFNTFINQLVSHGLLDVSVPAHDYESYQQSGAANMVDLYWSDFRQPFYRLFIPSSLIPPNRSGTSQTAENFVLASASNYTRLNTVNQQPSATNSVTYFRGRSIIQIMIRIRVNGQITTVPIGTTINNILETMGITQQAADRPINWIVLNRALGAVVLNPTQSQQAHRYQVRLGWNKLSIYSTTQSALDLPLLHGDQLEIRF